MRWRARWLCSRDQRLIGPLSTDKKIQEQGDVRESVQLRNVNRPVSAHFEKNQESARIARHTENAGLERVKKRPPSPGSKRQSRVRPVRIIVW